MASKNISIFCSCFLLVTLFYDQTLPLVNGAALPLTTTTDESSDVDVLYSPRVTDWGEWGDFEYCPENTFVRGMRLKTEAAQGPGDDTSLNGITFMCGFIGEPQRVLHSHSRQIQSLVGKWGTNGVSYECPEGYAVGFQLRSEPSQKHHDDTAANNLRIFCSTSALNNNVSYLEGSGLSWGDWTEPQLCKYGKAMCGIRTQVEAEKGHSKCISRIKQL